MVTVEEQLLETLEKLVTKEFYKFKWWLGLHYRDGFSPIPRSLLQKADVTDVVTLMVQNYNQEAVEVAKTVLAKIQRNDLVKYLTERTEEGKGVATQEPEPSEKIIQYQCSLQSYLHSKFMSVREGMTERNDERCLANVYTELFVTQGYETPINEQHEVRQVEMTHGKVAGTEEPIEPSNIFECPTGRPIRTVMTTGVAGIGKTFLVRKFVLDWAERKENQDTHLIFPFTFRELNLLRDEGLCLAKLIHICIWETNAITEGELNDIFKELQTSGNSNFKKSKFKLLFVLDGLDESRFQLDFNRSETQPADFNVTQSSSVEMLLTALIRGNLLPSARIWITTRPAAAHQIPRDFVDSMTVVRGFTDSQKVEYFEKKFPKKKEANRIISHIRASRSLFIMCHIPVFCWLSATVLQDVLKTRMKAELPQSLTDMYTEFVLYQIKLAEEKYGIKKSIQYIKSLAKLAFHQLEKHDPIFYEEDLKGSGIDFHQVALYSGVFTEVFKEVPRWKTDNAKGKMFSFVHLSLQEYLAALYVVMSLINKNKNKLSEPKLKPECPLTQWKRKSMTDIHKIALDKALNSPNGHLDLFLRFLFGLSLQTNLNLLKHLLKLRKEYFQNHPETISLIKRRIRENTSPEKSINLFYCLKELKDDSLLQEIQQYMSSGSLSSRNVSPSHWSALVFILLSSEDALEVFDLKKYSASEEGLQWLLPVVKASNKSLLSGCNLLEDSCRNLASVLSSQSSLRELDLSDNDLRDSGVKLISTGLESLLCTLQGLRLSGCMITVEGCTHLASALKSNPSHLKELDLSYNHPGDLGASLLSAGRDDPHWKLEILNLKHCGEQRMKPGLKKYFCKLALDKNTVHQKLKLSDNCLKVTTVQTEERYGHHAERFNCWRQVLCSSGLNGRCYWEVEWKGKVYIGVTYRGIRRKGEGTDGCLGANDHSWMLLCNDDGSFSVRHDDRNTAIIPPVPSECNKVAVFLDWPAGTLSFYMVELCSLVPLHTFNSTFMEPLYPAFGFGFASGFECEDSSLSLCEVDDSDTEV
ncbi:protein NLRC3-like [Leuresthes tenuis]|uniref:protein NLRC3-like n=1 Tax=Leuresthes tenuis TaxID=355514 RepID=UPI003B5122A7